jgi:2-C-methyl-D-erythritol 4-phosphate cytidylyltransferase
MNNVLIFAGGSGQRMNTKNRPKQFLEVHGKPIIIYTLETFNFPPEIDNILVVCIEDYIAELQRLVKRYDLDKVTMIIPGGETGFESIYNGLKAYSVICSPEDIVLIHDGVRPLIDAELISSCIESAKTYGTAIPAIPATEGVAIVTDGESIDSILPRREVYATKAPQTFKFGVIYDAYNKGKQDDVEVYESCHLCSLYGIPLHIVACSPINIKITTSNDYFIFRALHQAVENSQIIGY